MFKVIFFSKCKFSFFLQVLDRKRYTCGQEIGFEIFFQPLFGNVIVWILQNKLLIMNIPRIKHFLTVSTGAISFIKIPIKNVDFAPVLNWKTILPISIPFLRVNPQCSKISKKSYLTYFIIRTQISAKLHTRFIPSSIEISIGVF